MSTILYPMELQHPFRSVTSTIDGDVLTVLARANHAFTVATLERMIPHRSGPGIRLALERLVEQGTVLRTIVGRSYAFELNRNHLSAPAVIELAALQDALLERMRVSISSWLQQPLAVALFGSGARGSMRPDSDIDILIVRNQEPNAAWDMQVERLLSSVSSWTGNDARALEFHVGEIRGQIDSEPVLADILRDGIPVFGGLDRLSRLLRQR